MGDVLPPVVPDSAGRSERLGARREARRRGANSAVRGSLARLHPGDALIHFLNAVLGADLPRPMVTVEILNPYNEKEILDDKLSVVDVKARDAADCLYQIALQLLTHRDLAARTIDGWADLYASQLSAGQGHATLRPTYARIKLFKEGAIGAGAASQRTSAR